MTKHTRNNIIYPAALFPQEESEDLVKVTEAIDAVSTVNDPDSITARRRLRVRKRRADILQKKASTIVVLKRNKEKKRKPMAQQVG